mgnify:CR=1 FL=1
MKTIKTSAVAFFLSVFLMLSVSSFSQNARWYISSNTGQPWGSVSNTNGMNTVFGVGQWNAGFFQTIPSMTAICQPTTCFIFIEGGDGTAALFNTFLQANLPTLQNWVANGGRLLINSAPNVGGNINYGFGGVTLNYSTTPGNTWNNQGNAAPGMAGHPIFNGPYLPAGVTYTGNFFAHSHITGGGATAVIVGSLTNVPLRPSLSELNWGAGLVMFGGMTTANWHSPAPNGQNLFNNILSYMYVCCPAPTITAVASQTSICSGGTVSIAAGGASSYTFNPGGIMASSIIVSPTVSTIYTITGTSTTGCVGTKTVEILIDALTLTLTPSPATVCSGQPATITPSGGSNYTLNPGNVLGNTFTVAPIVASTYTVTGLSAIGCPNSQTVAVYTKTLPIVSPTSFTPLCAGSSLSLAVNALFSYTWTGPGGFTSNVQNPQIANATNSMSGIYSVTGLGANSCLRTTTMNVVLNVQQFVTPTITPAPPFCNTSAPFNMTVTPAGGGWSGNTIISNAGVVTPALSNTYGITPPITYTVFVGPCLNTQTTTLDVSFFNTAALSSSVPNLCVTNNPINLMNIVQSIVTGTWTGFGVNVGGGGNFSFNPAPLQTGIYPVVYMTSSSPNSLTCPGSTTLNISVTNTITPLISPVSAFCNNASSMVMTVTPTGGVWGGNSGVNVFGQITPSVCQIGSSIAGYTVQIGPCINTNTTLLNVSKFNTAALTGPGPHLCVTQNPFNLMSIVQSTAGGYWTGPTPQTSNNFFNPATLQTGTFGLTYNTNSSPNPTLCPDFRTATVHVLNPVSPTILQVGPFCSKDGSVQINVSPNNGNWTATGYLSSSGVLTPSLCGIGVNAIQYVVGTNTCNSSQTKYVTIEAFVPSTISNGIPNLCNTSSPVSLLPLTANNLGIWSGPGVTGANYFPSVTGAGSYVLLYKTASSPSGLCPDQSTVAVNVFSLAAPTLIKAGPFCNNGAPIQLQVNPVGGIFSGANNMAITPAGFFNPALASVGVGNIVNYSISSGPCIAYAQATIVVEKFVSAQFELGAGPFCNNDNPIDLNSLVQNPGGQWAGNGIVGHMFYPSKASIGINKITYNTNPPAITNSTLCPDESTIHINIDNIDVQKLKLQSTALSRCAPVEVRLVAQDIPGAIGQWSFGDGSQSESGLSVSHIFTSPGTYSVNFKYSLGACKSEGFLTNPITVLEQPKADFLVSSTEVFISDPEVNLTNVSSILGNNKYEWTIAGMNQVSEISPKIVFPQVGIYKIRLTATTKDNCKDEMIKTIEVKNDYNIFIPGSFTPNEDGLNDVFMPVFSPFGIDLLSFDMEIYDRWGHLIYHTKDISKGWNGTLQNKGETVLKQDSYVFKIRFKDNEGRLYNRIGNILLMGN